MYIYSSCILSNFKRRSSVGQTLVKFEQSRVDGKICQNTKFTIYLSPPSLPLPTPTCIPSLEQQSTWKR